MIGAHALTNRADITYRQLDFWTRAGYLVAVERDDYAGSGVPREYENNQLPVAIYMSRLTKAGIPAKVARAIADQLIDNGTATLGDFVLREYKEPA